MIHCWCSEADFLVKCGSRYGLLFQKLSGSPSVILANASLFAWSIVFPRRGRLYP